MADEDHEKNSIDMVGECEAGNGQPGPLPGGNIPTIEMIMQDELTSDRE